MVGFGLDSALKSLAWCKLRQFIGQVSSITSLCCVDWALIDQYISTSRNVRLRQLSTTKTARRVVWVTFLVWFLHGLPLPIYNGISVLPDNVVVCTNFHTAYQQYTTYFVTPFFIGIIPAAVMTVFGLLTYRNIKHLQQGQKRTTIERQLGQMLTLQVICVFVATCAYTTQNFYTLITMYIPKTPLRQAQENVGLAIALFFSFTCYTFNFYLYLIFSPSFRKQFTKVLKRCLGGDRNSVKPSNGALTRNTHKTCNTRSTRNGLSMVAFDGPPQQCSVVFLPKPSQVTKQSCN